MTALVINSNGTPSDSILGELFCFQVMFPEDHSFVDMLQEHPLLTYASTSDPDKLHYHEAMKAPDKVEFIKGMQEEVSGQIKQGIYSPILCSKVPEGATVLPSVWVMHCKCKVKMQAIYRWKSCLNLGGHKMVKGHNYDQVYLPTASWTLI
jgi:hypothetical protein